MNSLERQVRERLRQKKVFFSLRELEEHTGVSNVVLYHFLAGKSVRPINLRKIVAWLDGELPPAVEELDRLLAELLPDVGPAELKHVRRDVWEVIGQSFRRAELPIPDWLSRQTTQASNRRRPHKTRQRATSKQVSKR